MTADRCFRCGHQIDGHFEHVRSIDNDPSVCVCAENGLGCQP